MNIVFKWTVSHNILNVSRFSFLRYFVSIEKEKRERDETKRVEMTYQRGE